MDRCLRVDKLRGKNKDIVTRLSVKCLIVWFYLVILPLSGFLMSDCSLKLTNNAEWKVPLTQSTLLFSLSTSIWSCLICEGCFKGV